MVKLPTRPQTDRAVLVVSVRSRQDAHTALFSESLSIKKGHRLVFHQDGAQRVSTKGRLRIQFSSVFERLLFFFVFTVRTFLLVGVLNSFYDLIDTRERNLPN